MLKSNSFWKTRLCFSSPCGSKCTVWITSANFFKCKRYQSCNKHVLIQRHRFQSSWPFDLWSLWQWQYKYSNNYAMKAKGLFNAANNNQKYSQNQVTIWALQEKYQEMCSIFFTSIPISYYVYNAKIIRLSDFTATCLKPISAPYS